MLHLRQTSSALVAASTRTRSGGALVTGRPHRTHCSNPAAHTPTPAISIHLRHPHTIKRWISQTSSCSSNTDNSVPTSPTPPPITQSILSPARSLHSPPSGSSTASAFAFTLPTPSTDQTSQTKVKEKKPHNKKSHGESDHCKQKQRRSHSSSPNLGAVQAVNQLQQLIDTLPHHELTIAIFDRTLKVALASQDPAAAENIWLMLENVQPKDQANISFRHKARTRTPFKPLPHPLLPTSYTYGICIQTLCVEGHKTQLRYAKVARNLFQRASEIGHEFPFGTYSALIGALSGFGLPSKTGAKEIFDQLLDAIKRKQPRDLNATRRTPDQPLMELNSRVCAAMIHAWSRPLDKVLSPAEIKERDSEISRILQIMKEHKITEDPVAQSVRIATAARSGDFEAAERLANDIVKSGGYLTLVAEVALLHATANSSNLLRDYHKFEKRITSFIERVPNVKPDLVELRIETACRYHVKLFQQILHQQPKYLDLSAVPLKPRIQLILPLINLIRMVEQFPDYVYHKITYLHIFYALIEIRAFLKTLQSDEPGRLLLAEPLSSKTKSTTTIFPLDGSASSSDIVAAGRQIDFSGLLKTTIQRVLLLHETPLPFMFTYTLKTLTDSDSIENLAVDSDHGLLELLDDYLILALEPEFIAQAAMKPQEVVFEQLRTVLNDPKNASITELKGLKPPIERFVQFFQQKLVTVKHKSRACTLDEQLIRVPNFGQIDPALSGELQLEQWAFMIQNIKRKLSKKLNLDATINSPKITPPTTNTNSNSTIPSATTPTPFDPSTSPPTPVSKKGDAVTYLATRVLAMDALTLLFYQFYRQRFHAYATSTVPTQSTVGLSRRVMAPFLLEFIQFARTYSIMDELLQRGKAGEVCLALLLETDETRPIGITLFNHYRTTLLEEQEILKHTHPTEPEKQHLDPAARQLYRPMLTYLAQQNQLRLYDELIQELELSKSLDSPLFTKAELYRSELISLGLRGNSTKLLVGIDALKSSLNGTEETEKYLNSYTMCTFVEAMDRCGDENALLELVHAHEKYQLTDPASFRLLLRSLIRADVFPTSNRYLHQTTADVLPVHELLHDAQHSHYKLKRVVDGYLQFKWNPSDSDSFSFVLQLLKYGVMCQDADSIIRLLQQTFKLQFVPADHIRLTEPDQPIQFSWPSPSIWTDTIVPYPDFDQPVLFTRRSSTSHYHPLTQPSLIEFHSQFLQQCQSAQQSSQSLQDCVTLILRLVKEMNQQVDQLESSTSVSTLAELRLAQFRCYEASVKAIVQYFFGKF